MAPLIEAEDELHDMDKALEQLTGRGHAVMKSIIVFRALLCYNLW